jgi:predicted nuclease with TOPRIM domain
MKKNNEVNIEQINEKNQVDNNTLLKSIDREKLLKMKEEIQAKYNSLYEQLNQLEKNKQTITAELVKLSGKFEVIESLLNNYDS